MWEKVRGEYRFEFARGMWAPPVLRGATGRSLNGTKAFPFQRNVWF
jgi:hypothetical protein